MTDITMTQEQFFDQLNEIFDCDDGYINHLERIKKLEEEVHDWKQVGDSYFIETPEQLDEWLMASIHEDDEEYSKYMEPLELRQEVEKLKAENEKLKKDYDELFQVAKKRTEKDQEEIKKLKEVATKNYQSQIQKTLMGVQSA
tara:strand:- start:6089 stop:6517 length:429 start_codon:yes stop_codon:yes gene_type:complete